MDMVAAFALLLSVIGLVFVVVLVMKLISQDQRQEAAQRREQQISRY